MTLEWKYASPANYASRFVVWLSRRQAIENPIQTKITRALSCSYCYAGAADSIVSFSGRIPPRNGVIGFGIPFFVATPLTDYLVSPFSSNQIHSGIANLGCHRYPAKPGRSL